MRAMAVLKPIKLVITNYPPDKTEELDAVNNPEDPSTGTRKVPFSRELYIERDDSAKFRRRNFSASLPAGSASQVCVFVKCTDVVKDAKTGEITEIHCTYDRLHEAGTRLMEEK